MPCCCQAWKSSKLNEKNHSANTGAMVPWCQQHPGHYNHLPTMWRPTSSLPCLQMMFGVPPVKWNRRASFASWCTFSCTGRMTYKQISTQAPTYISMLQLPIHNASKIDKSSPNLHRPAHIEPPDWLQRSSDAFLVHLRRHSATHLHPGTKQCRDMYEKVYSTRDCNNCKTCILFTLGDPKQRCVKHCIVMALELGHQL